jgi:thiamine kinase-like enzyme
VAGGRPAPDTASLNRALKCLKAVRSGSDAPVHTTDPYKTTIDSLRELTEHGALSTGEEEAFQNALKKIRLAVQRRTLPNVPSHNDFTLRNLIDDGTQTWLIDWETGGWNDPFYDPATMIASHGLGDEHQELVIRAIWPDVSAQDRAHFDLMRFVTSLESATWCLMAYDKSGAINLRVNGLRNLELPRAWLRDKKVDELIDLLGVAV